MTNFEDFQKNAARFTSVVNGASQDRWAAPSPCEGWTAADVVGHVVDSQRSFLARMEIDVGPRPDGDPATVWAEHLAAVTTAAGPVHDREYDGHFGRTTIGETLASFYGFDMVVHRWDLARAIGQDAAFTDEEMDWLEKSIAGFGDQLYNDGVCKPPVTAPEGATRQERLLAMLGRDARATTGAAMS